MRYATLQIAPRNTDATRQFIIRSHSRFSDNAIGGNMDDA
jgi:hypothetical protein